MERRSGFNIMKRLLRELKSLTPVMFVTITMGVLGFLAAISINIFGVIAIGDLIKGSNDMVMTSATIVPKTFSMGLGKLLSISFSTALIFMGVFAVIRGPLRYLEQLSGHYIAFKILVILRDKIFTALRKLAPAKLENMEKGNLVSLITSDIELLEVFYAHTIAPIAIAVITNTIITILLFTINPIFGVLGGVFFIIVGFIIPYTTSRFGKKAGAEYRETFGKTNSYLLDSLRGLKEILIYKNGKQRLNSINQMSEELNIKQRKIKYHEGIIRALTDLTIMVAILSFVYIGAYLLSNNEISLTMMLLAIIIVASSFGPVVALSNLSNNLLQTFASAERLFNLIDEVPEVDEIKGDLELENSNINYSGVSFGYKERDKVLEDINLTIEKGDKVAIIGESGTGKSTFIKLLMRFWDVNSGQITLGNVDIKEIPTKTLRHKEALMSQETYLFNDTIEENIKIGKLDATKEEIIEAAKKASIHSFITTLPKGYDTKVGELGGSMSSGEKQRIGLARAFLRDADILILDEPTSNLDTLNEGVILKSIRDYSEDKTVILITHRKSTTSICERVFRLKNKKLVESVELCES